MNTISKEKILTQEVTIHASLSLVWYAWTISERISEWFAPEAVVEPVEGGTYELYFLPGNREEMNTKGCKVTKLVQEKELYFTWKGPDQFKEIMNQGELTAVKVIFESIDENSTRVLIKHEGFKDQADWIEAYNWHQLAWSQVLSSLKSALEKGEGNLCCQPN
ncbi:SRPBCC family protein [Heyndrickxia sp. NPDC080065]|uniref:SRPBCC family protein n=1 Tax=Heyndrickxia sp. NPDC080065 TaxID=3390568 RepID=UPI003CFE490D